MKKKLYIKGKCSICRGKALGCFYCDSEGLTFIEAADTVLLEILEDAEPELKQKIKEKVLGITYEAILELSSSVTID